MTDVKTLSLKDTIRALRACGQADPHCAECPLRDGLPFFSCFDGLMAHAADFLEASVSVQYE